MHKVISILTVSFLAISSLFSQERSDSLRTVEVENIIVSTRVTKREIIPVQILSGEELEKLSAHSVADAMRYFSGVQIKDYGGIGGLKTVNIRSLGTNHVGVFYDGIELGNVQNGVVDLGRFSLDNMEAVTLYNGQKSAIFQPAKDFASASAIYMRTRTPRFEEDKNYNLNFALKGGSFKTINPSVLWEQKLSDNISISTSAEYLYTSGEYKFSYTKKDGYDTTDTRKNGDIEYLRAETAVFGRLNGGEWRAKLYYYDSERGYPGAVVREEPGVFKNQDRQWDKNFFVQGSLRKSVNEWYSLLLNTKYAYDYLHYLSDPTLDVTTMYVNNIYKQQEAYGSLSNLFTITKWWSASVAADVQYNTLDANLVNFVYPQRLTALQSIATSITFPKIKVQGSLLHTFVVDQTELEGSQAAENKSIFTPTIVASYSPFDDIELNIRTFYKRVFRMPTLNDLYYTFIGNISLEPEFATQYNLGVGYGVNFSEKWLRRFELQVDAYFNQVDNKIIAMPTSNQFRWTMLNLGYVEIRGIDAVVQGYWKVGNVDISTRLNYTYQKAQDFTDPESEYYGGQIPYIPWHSGSVIAGAQYRGWGFNYSFIYTGERYESVANIPENYSPAWYTHDISLSKNIPLGGYKELRLTAEVNNLLNQQYEVVQCYPMPGINYKLKANFLL
ncbi:MAG: TonB-dependent receptor [Rikenellaceae bacterium]